MSCRNHGHLNISTCHCHCPPGYTGRYCQGERHLEFQITTAPGNPARGASVQRACGRPPWDEEGDSGSHRRIFALVRCVRELH